MSDSEQATKEARKRRRGAVIVRLLGVVGLAGGLAIVWQAVRGVPEPHYVSASAPIEIRLDPRPARYVRVVILRSSGGQPCLDELEVYGADPAANLALARSGAKATASSCLSGYASHRISHLNDGMYGNARSWIAATSEPGEWAQVELSDVREVHRVMISRDRRGEYNDRVPLWVDVLVSTDGSQWEKAGEMRGEPAPSGWDPVGRAIPFRQEHARYVRVSVLGTENGTPPALAEVRLYGTEPDVDLAAPSAGGKATTSTNPESAFALTDGQDQTVWSAAVADRQWVQIQLADRVEVNRITLVRAAGDLAGSFPRAFTVDISLDGQRWKTVAREGWGDVPPPPPFESFATSADETAVPRHDALGFANLALSSQATAAASATIPGHAEIHSVRDLNDGVYGNAHSWVSTGEPSWAEIDLGSERYVYRVAFSSDRTGRYADRVPTAWRVLTATRYDPDSSSSVWKAVAESRGEGSRARAERVFRPIRARWVRVAIEASRDGAARIDELEVYGSSESIPEARIGRFDDWPTGGAPAYSEALQMAFLGEEHAWLKTFGRADLDPGLTEYVRVWQYPDHHGDDDLPLPSVSGKPILDGHPSEDFWHRASRGTVRVASMNEPASGPLVEQRASACLADDYLYLALEADRFLSSHLAALSAGDWSGCGVIQSAGDGLAFVRYQREADGAFRASETHAIDGTLDRKSMTAELRVPLSWFPGARRYGLRLGLGIGGKHTSHLGRPIHLRFDAIAVAQSGPCAGGRFPVRLAAGPAGADLTLERPTEPAITISLAPNETRIVHARAVAGPIGNECDLIVAHGPQRRYALRMFEYDPLRRTLALTGPMLARLAAKGVDVSRETAEYNARRRVLGTVDLSLRKDRSAYLEARRAKRELMLRDPDLAAAQRVLCVRRHAYEPSHNYSDLLDASGPPGGSVSLLSIPRTGDRLDPSRASAETLFDAGASGVVRDAASSYDLSSVYFAWRDKRDGYFHLMRVGRDGKHVQQLTAGPFHDLYPTPLPDGGLAFISTRCKARFLCWRPQAYVLFRKDGDSIAPLSYANLSEWAPSIMRDGRILWTRSEYQDKGADFSHTLWSVRPDGTHADLVFGNTLIQPNGYAGAHEVPGTQEIVCTLISHFGDLNGPIALIDRTRGRFDPQAIRSLTPEVPWPGLWPAEECFRDPVPVSRDYFLCSHAPQRRFGVYLLDRYGNRELLFSDPSFSVMCPTPFVQRRVAPPLTRLATDPDAAEGEFYIADVYAGLESRVRRGTVKWIRICQEVRANLERVPGGYRADHEDFMDWYATPVHLVSGPFGWPSYVAKASWGLVPVESDGSARFRAPAGKVLYFSALDANYDEVQRMRSVVQLAPGERRGCIGCHEPRSRAPHAGKRPTANASAPVRAYPWDRRPFSFERDVQPVLDRHCVPCHNADHESGIDLRGDLGDDLVPQSYRTLISQGWLHYFDWSYNPGGNEKAEALTFGSRRSRLWQVLGKGHHGVRMSAEDILRIKTWTDLNCPLWPDYVHRPERARISGKPAQTSSHP